MNEGRCGLVFNRHKWFYLSPSALHPDDEKGHKICEKCGRCEIHGFETSFKGLMEHIEKDELVAAEYAEGAIQWLELVKRALGESGSRINPPLEEKKA